jgi:type 1 glutamine amidotransferase
MRLVAFFKGRKPLDRSKRPVQQSPLMKIFWRSVGLLISTIGLLCGEVPTIVFVAGEFEYHSKETLPQFAKDLNRDYKVKTLLLERPNDEKIQSIPGLEKLAEADLVVLMVRRMTLPENELKHVRKYLAAGKPLVGLRTASHAFENWKEFDAEVLGGNYQGHHGNQFKTTVSIRPEGRDHPILRDVARFVSDGSLYKNSPLRAGSKPLLFGATEGKPAEPIAWTHEYSGGRIFYTSLGHPSDFQNESFLTLLRNGIEWAIQRPLENRKGK